MRQVHRVPGTGVVDVVALLVRQQAVIAGVVDALEREGWAELVSFSGVIVDDVEDDLDAMGVELVDHGLEFVRERRPEVTRLRREEGKGVVAPVIAQAFLDQIAVVNEGMDRQQFCTGNAKRAQVGRNFRVRETGERAAVCVGHQRMQLGKPLDVHLVDDRPLPRHFRLARGAQVKAGSMTRHFCIKGALSRSS